MKDDTIILDKIQKFSLNKKSLPKLLMFAKKYSTKKLFFLDFKCANSNNIEPVGSECWIKSVNYLELLSTISSPCRKSWRVNRRHLFINKTENAPDTS